MPRRWKNWRDRFRGSRSALPSLDVLASSASPTEALENRLNWLVDVVQWIRRPGHEDQAPALPETDLQTGRLKRFLDVLDRNPEWKTSVARTLRSIIRETSALELFSETGLPRQYGMFREIGERFARKMLPPPGSAELGVLFDRLFPHPDDDAWIGKLDEPTLQRFRELLEFEIQTEELGWNALAEELEDSLFHLCAQLRVTGGSASIRARIKHQKSRELPFFKMTPTLQAILDALENMDADTMRAELNHLHGLIESGHRAVEEVLTHLEKRGVSTDVVYQLAFIEALLSRL
jgi:site-specific recombinase